MEISCSSDGRAVAYNARDPGIESDWGRCIFPRYNICSTVTNDLSRNLSLCTLIHIHTLASSHLDSLSGRENWCSVCNLREDMWRECFLCDAGQTWQSLWFSFVNPCCYGNIIFSLSFRSEKYFQKVTWPKFIHMYTLWLYWHGVTHFCLVKGVRNIENRKHILPYLPLKHLDWFPAYNESVPVCIEGT